MGLYCRGSYRTSRRNSGKCQSKRPHRTVPRHTACHYRACPNWPESLDRVRLNRPICGLATQRIRAQKQVSHYYGWLFNGHRHNRSLTYWLNGLSPTRPSLSIPIRVRMPSLQLSQPNLQSIWGGSIKFSFIIRPIHYQFNGLICVPGTLPPFVCLLPLRLKQIWTNMCLSSLIIQQSGIFHALFLFIIWPLCRQPAISSTSNDNKRSAEQLVNKTLINLHNKIDEQSGWLCVCNWMRAALSVEWWSVYGPAISLNRKWRLLNAYNFIRAIPQK